MPRIDGGSSFGGHAAQSYSQRHQPHKAAGPGELLGFSVWGYGHAAHLELRRRSLHNAAKVRMPTLPRAHHTMLPRCACRRSPEPTTQCCQGAHADAPQSPPPHNAAKVRMPTLPRALTHRIDSLVRSGACVRSDERSHPNQTRNLKHCRAAVAHAQPRPQVSPRPSTGLHTPSRRVQHSSQPALANTAAK
eukprot:312802-Chlamydomonas_euryale.AAC.3